MLTTDEFRVLDHTLTGGTGRRYRNHYSAGPGHSAYEVCTALVERGLMWVQPPNEWLPDATFHATLNGIGAWNNHRAGGGS